MKTWTEMTDSERDALVAEKVMGWERHDWKGFSKATGVPYDGMLLECQRCGAGPICTPPWTRTKADGYCGHDLTAVPYPEWSTEIAAAWEVVEKMRGDYDGHFTVMAFTTHWKAFAYTPYSREDIALQVSADTAPEAICLAALRAKGVDV